MNPGVLIGLAVLAYLFIRQNNGAGNLLDGGSGATGTSTTPAPSPQPTSPSQAQLAQCAAAGGVWDAASGTCRPLAAVLTTNATALAQALVQAAAGANLGQNPSLNYDQWSWLATNLLHIQATPDFSSVAPRDAGGSTPSVQALQYAGDYVRLTAAQAQSGMHGLAGMGKVLDLRQAHTPNKWTM